MKITRSDSGQLVIIDFPWVLGLVFLLCTIVLTAHFLHLLAKGNAPTKDLVGSVLGIGLFFFATAVFGKRSMFTFNRMTRQLTWSRLGLLTRKGGTLPFDQIESAIVQATSGEGTTLSYRLVLHTRDGILPFSEGYNGGSEGHYLTLRKEINRILSLPDESPPFSDEASIRALIQRGRVIEAIKEVRDQRGCSLAEAKDIVDRLRL